MDKELLNHSDIMKVLDKKDYIYFEDDSKDYNLNIVGVRTKTKIPEAFDDYIVVFWKKAGKWVNRVYNITTDPGIFYLNYPLNRLGTAILKENQYRSGYKIGLHQGRYTALTQAKPVTVLRDIDRDDNLDITESEKYTGWFGINIHRSYQTKRAYQVNKWSAGCQVFADPDHYSDFMELCRLARKNWGNLFTYTLLHESDFELIDEEVDTGEPTPIEPLPEEEEEIGDDEVNVPDDDEVVKPKTNFIVMLIRNIFSGLIKIFKK